MQESGSSKNVKHKVLLLGIGNTLHGDDGVGYCLVYGIKYCGGIEGADIANIQELNPGHITMLDGYETVVFIDAYISEDMPESARIAVLELDPSWLREDEVVALVQEMDPHGLNPIRLMILSYAAQLFKGRAYLIGIKPYRIEFSGGLSKDIKKALPQALEELRRILAKLGANMKADINCVINWVDRNCDKPLLD